MATYLLTVRDLSAGVEVYYFRDIMFTFYELTVIYLQICGLLDQ